MQERPFSLATVLYMIIRYGFLFLVSINIVLDMPLSVALEQELTTRCLFKPTNFKPISPSSVFPSCPTVLRTAIVVQIAVYAAVSGM